MDIPGDNAIAYNDAYDAALQHLAQQPKWSAEQAGMFRPSMNKDERYIPKAVKQEDK